MRREIKVIEITQPVGTFYVGKMNSNDLIKSFYVRSRNQEEGIQRDPLQKRISEIEAYCKDPDAAFPTPIILSLESSKVKFNENNDTIEYDNEERLFEILDGQHRVKGIQAANLNSRFECELLVVLMFDLTEEEKAYVFSTINSNQAKVDKSLIYDLFDLSTERSPLKTCHYIARIMNSQEEYPFYKKLKMLGKKESEGSTLSQGSFVKGLVDLISKNPQKDMIAIKNGENLEEPEGLVFRKLFINEKDDIILKIMKNYFNAVKYTFPNQWESDKYILTKTTGYLGLMKAFPKLYNLGMERKQLDEEFFRDVFKIVQKNLIENNKDFVSDDFHSGAKGQNDLRDFIINSIEEYYSWVN
jgi:DGQHR domain protein